MRTAVTTVSLFIAAVMTFVLVLTLGGEFVDLGLAIVQISSEAFVVVGALVVAVWAAAGDS